MELAADDKTNDGVSVTLRCSGVEYKGIVPVHLVRAWSQQMRLMKMQKPVLVTSKISPMAHPGDAGTNAAYMDIIHRIRGEIQHRAANGSVEARNATREATDDASLCVKRWLTGWSRVCVCPSVIARDRAMRNPGTDGGQRPHP